ncbi:MAG: glycosyltransferase family 39 protein, partial [Candidatus Omnitrophica bacterium]|nr:glycosyltransferase family 39 protein [Candidatus Omnitrophota bacterium]
MNIDEAHAAVIANSILEGKMPYKDAIDHRGPATYYLFALIFFLFGKNNMLAVHYCLIVLVALETFLIFMLGKKCFNTAAGLFAALFFAVFSWVNNPDDMWVFHTEWGVIVFSTLASICLIKAIKNNPFYFLISGIIFGMSFLSKQAGALDFGSALTFLVIVHLIRGRDTKKIILKLSLISIGFMLPYCLFVVYVSLKKALPDFLFYFWEYNTKYYLPAITLLEKFRRVPLFLFTFFEKRWLYLVFISLGISMTLNRLKLIKDNNAEAQYLLYFSLWSLAAIVSCCVTGRMFLHYGIQIFPPACILAGLSFEKISKKIWQSADEKDSVLKGSCQFFIGSLLFLGILLPSFRISLDYHKYMFTKKQIHPVSEYIF